MDARVAPASGFVDQADFVKYYSLAKKAIDKNQFQTAEEYLDKIGAPYQVTSDMVNRLRNELYLQWAARLKKPHPLRRIANRLFDLRYFSSALKVYNHCNLYQRNDLFLLERIGDCLVNTGFRSKAITKYQRGIRLSADAPPSGLVLKYALAVFGSEVIGPNGSFILDKGQLDLNGADFQDVDLDILSRIFPLLKGVDQIRSVSITHQVSAAALKVFATHIFPQLSLTALDFSPSLISDADLASFARILPRLKKLNVSTTRLGSDDGEGDEDLQFTVGPGAKLIGELLENRKSNLTYLDISNCAWTLAEVRYILIRLHNNTSLRCFQLNVEEYPSATKRLIKSLRDGNRTLVEFDTMMLDPDDETQVNNLLARNRRHVVSRHNTMAVYLVRAAAVKVNGGPVIAYLLGKIFEFAGIRKDVQRFGEFKKEGEPDKTAWGFTELSKYMVLPRFFQPANPRKRTRPKDTYEPTPYTLEHLRNRNKA